MDLEKEKELIRLGYKNVFGVDEVGRGPLAGPIVVCFYSFDIKNDIINDVNDSKKLSEKKRDKIVFNIKNNSKEYSIGAATNYEIDSFGIIEANRLAISRAYNKLKNKPDYILFDYTTCSLDFMKTKYEKIEKGDTLIYSIASASIIAKVCRDDLMKKVDEFFPKYEFQKHKGYGTARHCELIKENGLSCVHRKTFCKSIIKK